MPVLATDPGFAILSAAEVQRVIETAPFDAVAVARDIYELHEAGQTACPSVPFLRFPGKADARVIALPGYVGGRFQAAGLKWIASFPDNHRANIPRASACIVLNDIDTGRPVACLEGAQISAWRTAASASLAALTLNRGHRTAPSLAFVGCGVIARSIARSLSTDGWRFGKILCLDSREGTAPEMARWIREALPTLAGDETRALAAADIEQATSASLIVFATTALQPHVALAAVTNRDAVVLHISLRDLGPDAILAAYNVVDDRDNCFAERTSIQLAEQQSGGRSFVNATLAELTTGKVEPPSKGLRIFSPFGLSALDIGFAKLVFDEGSRRGTAVKVESFL